MRIAMVALCLVFVAGSSAFAEEEGEALGELHVTMNSDYAKFLVNGEEWTVKGIVPAREVLDTYFKMKETGSPATR